MKIADKNKKGFSLIETLIAMLILFFILLALFMATALLTNQNFMNSIRNEAIRLAETRMSEMKNTPFDSLSQHAWGHLDLSTFVWSNDCQTLEIRIRNVSNFPFTICERIGDLSSATKQINIAIGWDYKGTGNLTPTSKKFQHVISSTVSR